MKNIIKKIKFYLYDEEKKELTSLGEILFIIFHPLLLVFAMIYGFIFFMINLIKRR